MLRFFNVSLFCHGFFFFKSLRVHDFVHRNNFYDIKKKKTMSV